MKSSDLDLLPDRELLEGLRSFNTGSAGTPADYALTAAQVTELQTELSGFATDLDSWEELQVAEAAALAAKKARRAKIIKIARQQFKLSRAASGMTDEKLAGVNLDPYDTEPSTSRAPTSVPIAHIDYGKLKHTIYFRDSQMPDSEAKPEGVKGCDIYRFIGDAPPASETGYDYVTNDSSSPYVAFYDGTQAGKTVHYILRWVSKADEFGEWSQVIKATING